MGLYAWAAAQMVRAGWRRLRAWWARPLLMPRPPKTADTYGRHDRSVGEQTIPLADLLAQLDVPVAPRRRREPPLFGTDPIDLWTHPERYGKPTSPPVLAATAASTPDFDDTEVSA